MADEPVKLDYASPPSNPRRPFMKLSAMEWIVVVAIIAVLVSILLPTFHEPRRPISRIKCLVNLKQIGTALIIYAQQNNGVYPAQLADTVLVGATPQLFDCPDNINATIAVVGPTTQQTIANLVATPSNMSYIYAAPGATQKSLPPQAVLVYEPVGFHKTQNQGVGVVNVLFADGHAVSIPTPVATQMIKELTAGQNPPPATKGY